MDAAIDFALEEAGGFENAEMLGDCGEGEGERLGELGDGGFTLREAGENGSAGGVGECGESGVERGSGIVNHTVYYCRGGVACQENFSAIALGVNFQGTGLFSQGLRSWRKLRPSTIWRKERVHAAAAC